MARLLRLSGTLLLRGCHQGLRLGGLLLQRTRPAATLVPLLEGIGRQLQRLQRLAGMPSALPGEGRPTQAMLLQALEAAQRQQLLHPCGLEIAQRALSFAELTVDQVMVPRHRIVAIPKHASAAAIRRLLLEEGHACVPVFENTLDHIVGILAAKDVLAMAWEGALIVLDDLLQPPYFAPEVMRAADLLKVLQRRRQHFAVVVDELGGTAGIVTIEDLLEELVGDIVGDHDADAAAAIHPEADGSVLCLGTVAVRELNRELQLQLEEGDAWTTVGGLCVGLAGGIPAAGQQLLGSDGVILEVVEATERHVRQVRLRGLVLPDKRPSSCPPALQSAP